MNVICNTAVHVCSEKVELLLCDHPTQDSAEANHFDMAMCGHYHPSVTGKCATATRFSPSVPQDHRDFITCLN